MKQKVLSSYSLDELHHNLEQAIAMGWFVQTISSNEYGWIAVLIKEEQ